MQKKQYGLKITRKQENKVMIWASLSFIKLQLCNGIAFKDEIKRAKTRHPYRAPLKCEGGCMVPIVQIAEKKWSEWGEKDRVSIGESEYHFQSMQTQYPNYIKNKGEKARDSASEENCQAPL